MTEQTFIGRQPIMDLKQHIIGYELFFRHSAEAQTSEIEDGFKACINVLKNTTGEMDMTELLGDSLAFMNIDEKMLHSELLEILPPKRTVLEILRTVPASEAIIERCQALRQLGFHIALDNPHLNPDAEPLLAVADYIKIDIQSVKPDRLDWLFVQYNKGAVKLIAEKVESEQEFALCKEAGYQYFQGFYFAKPETLTAKVINPTFDSVLSLLNKVSQDADYDEIEAGFKKDAALSFKLLRYINSVGFGLSCEVQSINHALTILGSNQLYRWLTLLMVTAGENATPIALMKTAVTRGRLTELLGEGYFEKKDRDNLFIVGTFSLLDAIVKMPIDEVLDKIQLPEPVAEAILTRQGVYGPFLQLSEACESADDERILALAESLQMHADKVNKCHLAALTWVDTLGIN
jgi:c-di-GMP phosphodiesterase